LIVVCRFSHLFLRKYFVLLHIEKTGRDGW
jgi:hypothetical protein